jgi:hypothetical protein
MPFIGRSSICCLCLFFCAGSVVRGTISDGVEYGPFVTYRVAIPIGPKVAAVKPAPVATGGKKPAKPKEAKSVVEKGITVSLDATTSICFDTDLMRYAAGWTGGFIEMANTNSGSKTGHDEAQPIGEIRWTTPEVQGATSGNGNFLDPRPDKQGPLARTLAHYRGLYKNGTHVVLSYTVGDVGVYDLPGVAGSGADVLFTRTLQIDKATAPVNFLLAEEAGATSKTMAAATHVTAMSLGQNAIAAVLLGQASSGAKLTVVDGKLVLTVPPHAAPVTLKVGVWSGAASDLSKVATLAAAAPAAEDIATLLTGGPAQWAAPVAVTSTLGAGKGAYVVDTIGLPDGNPWGSRMKPGAMDFFKDGRLAVSTYAGDVWIASGLDDTLGHVTWKRFAAGLYETLGLKVVDDQIYVLGRDQITLLHDLNGDGEADFYENFNNDQIAADTYHAFVFDLQTDSHGDFFYAIDGNLCDPSVKNHGIMMKVSKYGDKSELYAKGFRAPNGTGMGPNDELVCSDNQGHWTPVDRINLVKKGGFYGYRGDPRLYKAADVERLGLPAQYDPPICWIPYKLDNSAGGEVWATSTKWGPLDGQMLQTSYGKSIIMEVIWEMTDGVPQGGVVRLPLEFESGIMRARFSPIDGQLYVCGFKGWQTNARHEGCLQRVRYTGKPANLPIGIHIRHDGIELKFSGKLDPMTANDRDSYNIEQWNYKYFSTYEAPELKVSNPAVQGHDVVPLKSAKLQPDGQTIFLQINNLQPVMQMAIQCKLDSADGMPVECEIDNTINKVPAK